MRSGLPALPVINDHAELCGIFGEREFMAALFPGYVRELGYAGFVPRKLDEAFEKRAACAREPIGKHMNTEHIDVAEDFSDVEVAETFLHHRVLILPVTETDTSSASSPAATSSSSSRNAFSAPCERRHGELAGRGVGRLRGDLQGVFEAARAACERRSGLS